MRIKIKPNQPGQSNQNRSFVFIDVIAIIQNVNFSEEKEEQARRNPWYKKILNWFKKKGE